VGNAQCFPGGSPGVWIGCGPGGRPAGALLVDPEGPGARQNSPGSARQKPTTALFAKVIPRNSSGIWLSLRGRCLACSGMGFPQSDSLAHRPLPTRSGSMTCSSSAHRASSATRPPSETHWGRAIPLNSRKNSGHTQGATRIQDQRRGQVVLEPLRRFGPDGARLTLGRTGRPSM
jgi:hypothetical protein